MESRQMKMIRLFGRPVRIDWLLLVILAVALAYRLILWQIFRGYQLGRDEVDYFRTAIALYQDGTFIDPNPVWIRVPLFPLIAAGFFHFFGPNISVVNLFQIALSVANAYLVFLLGKWTFGRRAGLIAAFLFAVFPPLATYPSTFFMTEPIFAFLMTLMLVLVMLALRTKSYSLAAVCGLLLGLACLTRPSAIVFAPVIAGWLIYFRRRDWKPALMSVVLAAIVALVVITPWTIRNYQAFGRVIFLDNIGAYNLWRDNNYDRRENVIQALEKIPNPADRQSYAMARGLENITSYPVQFLAGGVQKMNYLWHLELDSYAHFDNWDVTNRQGNLYDILPVDALLIVIGLSGAIGAGYAISKIRGPEASSISLVLLFLLASMGPAFAFHSEARFRIDYLPALLLLSAVPFAVPKSVFTRGRYAALKWLGVGALGAWVLVGAYSPAIMPLLTAKYDVWRGDMIATTNPAAAEAWYQNANQAMPNAPYGWDSLGDLYRYSGQFAKSASIYNKALKILPGYVDSTLGLADDFLQTGNATKAASLLTSYFQDDVAAQLYPWNNFAPSASTAIDIGTGGEVGHILGFFPAEKVAGTGMTFRWTGHSSSIKFILDPGQTPKTLKLWLAGSRPEGVPSPKVVVKVNGAEAASFVAQRDWYSVEVPLRELGGDNRTLVVEVQSETFRPKDMIPGSTDDRELGVAIDRVELGF
jgi:4-amino-4-deoxy-L-arabinose transferase-like glycosyltransferase